MQITRANKPDEVLLTLDDEFSVISFKNEEIKKRYEKWVQDGFTVFTVGGIIEGSDTDGIETLPVEIETLGAFQGFLLGEGLQLVTNE